MKIFNNISLIVVLLAIMFTSCSDFLEKEPLSSGTDAIFFKTPAHFVQAANALYDVLPRGWDSFDGSTDLSGVGPRGGGSAQEGGAWSYTQIRRCCVVIQKAEEYSGDPSEIAGAVGTAHFFRAWSYYDLLTQYGGVPLVDHVVDLDDPIVYGPRNSRYEIADLMFRDLRIAVEKLPRERDIASADKGKVCKEAAQAFFARVLLYEGTWEKYVPNIGYDLDGDGVTVGAGKAKPANYPSYTEMLEEAKQMSRNVILEAETGTFQIWHEADSLSYYYLFALDDKGGNLCNPYKKGKATNKEYIFHRKYDHEINTPNHNLGHVACSRQVGSISAQFGYSFLCLNGLPIFISTDGVTRQLNPQFLGFGYDAAPTSNTNFWSEYRNRDYRYISSIWMPDRIGFGNRGEYVPPPDGINPYGTPVYPSRDPYKGEAINPNDPWGPTMIETPVIGPNSTHNGWSLRKFNPEGTRPERRESPDWPLIRLAEVHCIYAEATVELSGGTISDADLNFSINKNRARAHVAPLTNALIANMYDAGWFDHAQGKTVIKKMNMLDEIRRERAAELFNEGLRLDDLKRWGVAHIYFRGQKLGRFVLNSAFETGLGNNQSYWGKPTYDPVERPLTWGINEGTGSGDLDYGRAKANNPVDYFYVQRDYLSYVSLLQMRLNPALLQNPGW